MKKFALTFVIAMLLYAVVSVPGCDKSRKIPNKIPSNFDYGSWTGSTYRNDFFGFSITVPENWYVSGDEDMKIKMDRAQDMDFVNNEEAKKQRKVADITTANLLFTARYSTEEAIKKQVSNPNIALIAENLPSGAQQIDRAKYVKAYCQGISQVTPDLVIKSQTNKTIGGQEFTSVEVQFSIQEVPIYQEHLICLKNDFALCFALSSLDDSEKQQLDDIMATLKWD